MRSRLLLSAALFLSFAGSAYAQIAPLPISPDRRLIKREVREARVAACAGRPAGAPCSFTTPKGRAVNSVCAPNRRGMLMCKPPKSSLFGFHSGAAPLAPGPGAPVYPFAH